MPGLLDKMIVADVWVLGTPIYYAGPTTQFKAFQDRWYGAEHAFGKAAFFKGKRVILVIPMGDTDPGMARHTVGMMEEALDWLEMELIDTVLAPGVNELGEVKKHPELMDAAYRAGQKAAA
jgi:multimeric flavodoxin WrbA